MPVVVAVTPVTTWIVNRMKLRLEAATPVQALVKKPRRESGEAN